MNIEWKDPSKELPEDGAYVAILLYHNKCCWPQSAEIYFGQVESHNDKDTGKRKVRVLNNDFIGAGSAQWYFDDISFYEKIQAWCYAKEFQRPSFIEHNPWWGKERL